MDYWHYNFICPYFKWDKEKSVGCTGKHSMKFDSKKNARDFMKKYCAGWAWEQCPHAQEMIERYERSEEWQQRLKNLKRR